MKKYTIVVIIALLFSTNYSQVDSLKSLFPLQIGNLWQYKISHVLNSDTTVTYGTTEIFKDTIIEGKNYFKIGPKGWPLLSDDNDSLKYLRYILPDNSVVQYSIFSGEEIIFKLDALASECWEYFHLNFCCSTVDTVLSFGEYRLRKVFGEFEVPQVWGYEVQKGIGPIKAWVDDSWSIIIWTRYDLVYAKINGTEYGSYVTNVRGNEDSPFSYSLFQNFPNPFNPTTTIKIVIPKSSFVNLKVYDLLGREDATLVNEEKPAGNYEVEFDGIGLSSGIYFYKLQAENYSSVKKMLLLK